MHITNATARKCDHEAIAVALWRLATGDSFKSCGLQFGIGMSSAKTICAEFEIFLLRLKDQFIKFPLTRQELQELMGEFEEEYGILQIRLALLTVVTSK